MYAENLKCTYGCDSDQSQAPIFTKCLPLMGTMKKTHIIKFQQIYGDVTEQKEAAEYLCTIEKIRKEKDNLLPGGVKGQDPCIFAAEIV